MHKRFYTLVFVNDPRGRIRKLNLPGYAVPVLLVLAALGLGVLIAGAFSYGHLLLTVKDYRAVRAEREQLRAEKRTLQASQAETSQKLTSLESLANEVATSYGLLRLKHTPFGTIEPAHVLLSPEQEFMDTVDRYNFLRHHATAVTLYARGVKPMPGRNFTELNYTPSLWPVRGRLSGAFGDRIDPFNGEGAFHSGVDISAQYGAPVRSAADGFVVWAGRRSGFGRLVVVDHGGGVTTWYAHMSSVRGYAGQSVKRGDVVGYVGSSGRAKGNHLHYEVRLNNAPLNPWNFLRTDSLIARRGRFPTIGSSD